MDLPEDLPLDAKRVLTGTMRDSERHRPVMLRIKNSASQPQTITLFDQFNRFPNDDAQIGTYLKTLTYQEILRDIFVYPEIIREVRISTSSFKEDKELEDFFTHLSCLVSTKDHDDSSQADHRLDFRLTDPAQVNKSISCVLCRIGLDHLTTMAIILPAGVIIDLYLYVETKRSMAHLLRKDLAGFVKFEPKQIFLIISNSSESIVPIELFNPDFSLPHQVSILYAYQAAFEYNGENAYKELCHTLQHSIFQVGVTHINISKMWGEYSKISKKSLNGINARVVFKDKFGRSLAVPLNFHPEYTVDMDSETQYSLACLTYIRMKIPPRTEMELRFFASRW